MNGNKKPGNKKAYILLAVLLAVAIVLMVVGYVVKGKDAEGDAADAPAEVLSISGLVDTTPDELWEQDEATGYHGFTTRTQLQLGDAADSIGVLRIEKIGLECFVYDSDEETVMEDMKHGAAHYKSTSYWDGNVAMSAHNGNASYSFFDKLPQLAEGDTITYETTLGTRSYVVVSSVVIADDDWSYLGRTEDNRLTLTTCVTGQPAQRLCVQAVEASI